MEEVLNLYRQWLLQLTICDPACGSGAFLNATLRFLMEEHHKLDEMATYIMGREDGRLIFPDVENDILEKNLYGVDINEESVEIARLSLWLRTAKPYRKLSSLNDNIKCGNSLIGDSSVDREKAFDWEKEFPQVFQKGGFDVVIGNPPYLRIQGMRQGHNNEVPFYEQHFMSATGKFDYYVLFMEKGFSLIKEKGLLSYILPHKFITASFGVGIRSFIAKHRALKSLLHFGAEQVFDLASVYTCIITLSKNNNEFEYARVKPSHLMNSSMVLSTLPMSTIADAQKWNLQEEESATILEKLDQCPLRLQDIYKSCSAGIVSMGDDLYMMKGRIEGDYFIGFSEKCNKEIKIEAQIVRPILKGEDVKRYSCPQNEYYMIYPHYLEDGKTCTYTEEELKTNFPLCYEYLLPYKEDLVKTKIYSKENPIYWYGLHRPRKISMFEQKKIITAEISLGCNMTIDENNLYHNTTVYTIDLKEEYKSSMCEILAILNSKVMWYYLSSKGCTLKGGYFRFKTRYIESFPIPDITSKEDALREKSVFMLRTTAELGKVRSCFHRRMKENFELRKVSKMLETADDLSFAEFLKELKKQKVKLSLVQQDEWEEYFSQYKEKCLNLRDALRKMEKEIDTLVYALYGLTEEEIKVVEGSIK
ncbi:MAG TPA: hypothetical protein DDY68_04100 [Porphyromonadaceae bacterium]|nr:hypothetical protein [Porphyromonadaceae bacterium]